MPLGNPTGGGSYAAEFQSSALPWVTSSLAPAAGSPLRLDFGMVTRFITVSNTSTGSISFGVTYLGLTTSNHKIVVPAGQYLTLEWRITSLFIQSEALPNAPFSVAAGLTTIRARDYFPITGSAADGTSWPGVG